MVNLESTLAAACVVVAAGFGVRGDDAAPPPSPLLSVGKLDPAHERHLDELLRRFQDPDPTRRHDAIAAVGRTGDAAVPAIRARIRGTSNGQVQRCGLIALAWIGGEAAAASAREVLRDGKLREDELAVAYLALGALDPGSEAETLAAAANSKKATIVRRAAILALARASRLDLLEPAFLAFSRDPLADSRVALLLAASTARTEVPLDVAIAGSADRSAPVRRAACAALGEWGDPRASAALVSLLRNERDETVLAAAALALGRCGSGAEIESLRGLLDHTDEEVRDSARSALAARHDGASEIADLLGRERDSVRLARLAASCAASRVETLDQPLQALLTHARAEVRAAAGLALAARESKGSGSALARWLLAERDHAARADALRVCGALGVSEAKDLLRSIVAPPGREDLVEDVRRTLDGRRDPALCRAEVENRLRELRAREFDRRDETIRELTGFVFDFASLSKFVPGSVKPPPGTGSGSGDGGGDGGTDGGGSDGGGSDGGGAPGGLLGKPKVDRKNTVVERDLESWFRERPYLQARRP